MRLGKKVSGGMYHSRRKKRLHERTAPATQVVLGESRVKQVRTRGGHIRQVTLRADEANVLVGKKMQKVSIVNVVETPQNKFFSRQNRLAKGVIIDTSAGRARITNRPSREGIINAVLIKE